MKYALITGGTSGIGFELARNFAVNGYGAVIVSSKYNIRKVNAQTSGLRQRPAIIDVVLFNYEDKYISLVKQSLEDIQK